MNRKFLHEDIQSGRWIPPWLRYQNLARYRWASQFVVGKNVVEIGCGSGHGAKMLLEAGALDVRGFDVEEEAIVQARERYADDRLQFDVAPGGRLPATDASCDVCVSLETIEHIDETSPYLAEVARILRDGGSVPVLHAQSERHEPGKAHQPPTV